MKSMSSQVAATSSSTVSSHHSDHPAIQQQKPPTENDACANFFVKYKNGDETFLLCTLPMALTNSSLEHLSPLLVKHAAMLDHDDYQLSQYLTKMISKENSDKVTVEEVRQEMPDKSSASIEVGDFVSLLDFPTLTLEKASSVDEAASLEKCLGDKSWGRVGVVVAKRDAKMSTVKEIFSGRRADYVDQDLTFADGTPVGMVEKLPPVKAGPSTTSCFFCEAPTAIRMSTSKAENQPRSCAWCRRSSDDQFCGVILFECQSHSCKQVACAACLSRFEMEQVQIDPSAIKVSSGEFTRGSLCKSNIESLWQSDNVSDIHWIEVSLQCDWEEFRLQIHNKALQRSGLISVSVSCDNNDGKGYSRVRSVDISDQKEWWTLTSSSDTRSATLSPGHQSLKVKIEIAVTRLQVQTGPLRLLANPLRPLDIGERVRLAPTFSENQGDGWCLGSVKDQRVGVVVAIGGHSIDREQRSILVYCAASTTKLALFKASWLERAPPTMTHCVGDLVQLNPATSYRPADWTIVAGKCLGRPFQGLIGVVTAIGPMVAGIQRNVQVALLASPSATADGSSACARVSLYCASKLVRAEPWLSMHPQVTAALVHAVERAARKSDGTSLVNGDILVNRLGIHVWGKMLNLLGKSSMLEHVYGWILDCAGNNFHASVSKKEMVDYYACETIGDVPERESSDTVIDCTENHVAMEYIPERSLMAFSSSAYLGPNVFSPDKTKVWCPKIWTRPWLEFVIPPGHELCDLSIITKDLSLFPSKDIVVSVIPFWTHPTKPFPSISSPTPCGNTCSLQHNSDYCVVCENSGPHDYNNHTCEFGMRSSFVKLMDSDPMLSACYPEGSLIKVRNTVLPSSGGTEIELLSPPLCATLKPRLVRVEFSSNYLKSISVQQIRAWTIMENKPSNDWLCNLCFMNNAATIDSCHNCRARRASHDGSNTNDGLAKTRNPANELSKASSLNLDRFAVLGKKKALAWNCSFDSLGRNQVSVLDNHPWTSSTVVTSATAEKRFNATILPMGPSAKEPITDFHELVRLRDEGGNLAAHQLAFMGLRVSFSVLIDNGGRHQLFKTNIHCQTPAGLLDGVTGPARQFSLHRFCSQRALVKNVSMMPLSYPEDYSPSGELAVAFAEIQAGNYDVAIKRASQAAAQEPERYGPHYRLYVALASLNDGYGSKAVEIELEEYVAEVQAAGVALEPVYFFLVYLLFKLDKPSSKLARSRAADALAVFRLFPVLQAGCLTMEDNLDEIVHREDESNGTIKDDDEGDEDDDELEEELDPRAPEVQWRVAKAKMGVKSPAMDKLMGLVGLRKVKERALAVYQRTLLDPFRPSGLDATTAMNFLFIGNPGCGKTTVAELLAAALVELKFRKNPTPCLTSAARILKAKDPLADFEAMVKKAEGGTVFIDECYLLKPSPPGQQANASNAVLDYLMEVSETMRSTTTFILAGYKDDVERLLTYNEGFPSRFPKVFTFAFEDYTQPQLRQILLTMVKQRGFRFKSQRSCGVSISKVMSMRIARGRGVKGFGNAREVRNQIDACIQRQEARFGAMIIASPDPAFTLSAKQMVTLTKADTIGVRPNLEQSPALNELDAMVGLESVKRAVRGLMQLQLQNYDREMRGEDVERISLHRVFFGNPGTGKTTVARLYGRVLKEFGLLSDGDFIATTASSLMGEHVGAGATQTLQLLERAKGKVVFIDEAYVLDPKRRGSNDFGGSVLDTLVERIDGSAGMDMAVILAGYEPEMLALFRNCGNPGLARRFQLSEALRFEDFSDKDLKTVLKRMVVKERLVISQQTVEEAIKLISRRRRLPDFGNAGEVENFLGRAKANKALRLGRAAAAFDDAQRTGRPTPKLPRPDVLVLDDFVTEETSVAMAKEGFATMQNMDHILAYIHRLEATMLEKKREGKSPSEIVADAHMIFTGPPGTGKTTAARKFGQLFYHLELLPTDRVVETTAKTMMGQYVGQTAQLVTAKMEEARGGILFIDEAYSLVPSAGSFASDAVQTLLDNITKPEFKGNLVIILAGYEKDLDMLFTVNAGLSSRFDKHRISFPSWTAAQARDATVAGVHRDNKTLTADAIEAINQCYLELESLPSWASARDVYESVLPQLYSHRAERLAIEARSGQVSSSKASTNVLPGAGKTLLPYTVSDVQLAVGPLLKSRRAIAANLGHRTMDVSGLMQRNYADPSGSAGFQQADPAQANTLAPVDHANGAAFEQPNRNNNRSISPVPAYSLPAPPSDVAAAVEEREPDMDVETHNARDMSADSPSQSLSSSSMPRLHSETDADLQPAAKRRKKTQFKYKALDPDDLPAGQSSGDASNLDHLVALLEEACAELGYTIQQMNSFLSSGTLPSQVLDLVWSKNGGSDSGVSLAQVTSALQKHLPGLLVKVRPILRQMEEEKTAEEQRKQEKLKKMGLCCMGFEWLKVKGGYRCAGGSHYCSDTALNA